MSEWRAQGKQVLQDGKHFADAAGEIESMMIVNALRALDHPDCPPINRPIGAPTHRGGVVAPPERPYIVGESGSEYHAPSRRPILNLNTCRVMRQSDEMVCPCGLRWDVNDPEPPRCAHRA